MSDFKIISKTQHLVSQFDEMIFNNTVDHKFVEELQEYLDKVDELTKGKNLKPEELSVLYELQALIYATEGKSPESDEFIVEAVILSGGEQYLYSSVIREYIQDYDYSVATTSVSPKDLPYVLTGDPKVLDSMIYIQRAGFWAMIMGIVMTLISIMIIILSSSATGLYLPIGLSIYLIYSGYKLNRLEGRGSILAMLITNALFSLVLGIAVLPLITLIITIIALLKIKYYQEWRLEWSGDFIQAIKS